MLVTEPSGWIVTSTRVVPRMPLCRASKGYSGAGVDIALRADSDSTFWAGAATARTISPQSTSEKNIEGFGECFIRAPLSHWQQINPTGGHSQAPKERFTQVSSLSNLRSKEVSFPPN